MLVDVRFPECPEVVGLSDKEFRILIREICAGGPQRFPTEKDGNGQRRLMIGGLRMAIYTPVEIRDRQRTIRRQRKQARRQRIIDRDGMVCGICTTAIASMADLHIDHIKPLARGGTSAPENLQPSHSWCNIAKGDKWHEADY